jgi:hypothetical protein
MADRIKDSSFFNGGDPDLPLKYFDMHDLRASTSFRVFKPVFTSELFSPIVSFPSSMNISLNMFNN